MKYTKKDLKKMPLSVLRGLDIVSPEDEAVVQEIVSERLAELPPENPLIVPTTLTDDMTPEKEKKLQEKIDARYAALKKKTAVK